MFKRKKEPARDAKTLVKCASCGEERVRDYEPKDTVFSQGEQCVKCKKPVRVELVFARLREP